MNNSQLKEKQGRQQFYNDMNAWYTIEFSTEPYSQEDFWMTARTDQTRTYIGDVKNYNNPEHPRAYNKFVVAGYDKGYMIDYEKIDYLVTQAEKQGRTPILYAHFSDCTLVWDLSKIPYKERKEERLTNKNGYAYGEKEWSWQTFLYRREAVWSK